MPGRYAFQGEKERYGYAPENGRQTFRASSKFQLFISFGRTLGKLGKNEVRTQASARRPNI